MRNTLAYGTYADMAAYNAMFIALHGSISLLTVYLDGCMNVRMHGCMIWIHGYMNGLIDK